MGNGHSQSFGNHLRGGGCAQELATAAGRGAGAAAKRGRFFNAEVAVHVADADALDFTSILAGGWRQGHAAGDED